MKRPARNTKKLAFNKITLRRLESHEVAAVVGGCPSKDIACYSRLAQDRDEFVG